MYHGHSFAHDVGYAAYIWWRIVVHCNVGKAMPVAMVMPGSALHVVMGAVLGGLLMCCCNDQEVILFVANIFVGTFVGRYVLI